MVYNRGKAEKIGKTLFLQYLIENYALKVGIFEIIYIYIFYGKTVEWYFAGTTILVCIFILFVCGRYFVEVSYSVKCEEGYIVKTNEGKADISIPVGYTYKYIKDVKAYKKRQLLEGTPVYYVSYTASELVGREHLVVEYTKGVYVKRA